MRNILVTAAILQEGDKFLVAQRLPGGMYGGKWEFPGGKVEPGESPEEALVREIQEELEMDVEVGDVAGVITQKQEQLNRTLILLYYYCKKKRGSPRPVACQDFNWTTVNEVLNYDLAPADRMMAERLIKSSKAKAR